ncbi:MAG: phosphatase domain-containing protein [bacterium]|nr:phosphatase domain-containing protein [bacterium]
MILHGSGRFHRILLTGLLLAAPGILLAAAPAPASELKADEEIVFFPTAAHLDVERGRWVVPVHGWVFEPEEGSIWRSALVGELLQWLELGDDPVDEEIFRGRARLFLVDNERGKSFALRAAGLAFRTLPSGPEGHFGKTVEVDRDLAESHREGDWLPFQVDTGTTGGRKRGGRVQLIPPGGLSVISDIDDTIKVSNVLDKEELLANTFLKEYRPVPGMAEAYRAWEKEGAVFHYVSASPWQLYLPLAGFMSSEGFPPGAFTLRSFRIKDRTFFNLFASPMETKVPVIGSIMSRYPGRKFILVGDAGEKDPEVYGEIARTHADQVARILIRDVPGGDVSKKRMEAAFKEVDADRWKVFNDAGELPVILSGL